MHSSCIITFVIILLSVFSFASSARKDPTLDEVFNFLDTNYPTTPFLDGLGNCNFPITSSVQSATLQNYSNMGMCMLHTFWPSESLRAFREILKIDNNNAMGYWGVYQSLVWDSGFEHAALEAKQRAIQLAIINKLPDRERLYIETLKFNSTSSQWNKTYYDLFNVAPTDLNAKGLWAWSRISDTIRAMANPFPERKEVQDFLKYQTNLHPKDVGMQHYTIHAWEDSLTPGVALNASLELGGISPNAGHNVHMPGHIYFLLGDHETAHNYFQIAREVDEKAMKLYNVNFQEYWEYIHNLAYMGANLAEGGRYAQAYNLGVQLRYDFRINRSRPALLDWDPRYSRPAGRYFFQGLLISPLVLFLYEEWSQAELFLQSIVTYDEIYQDNGIKTWLPKYYEGLQKYACVMRNYKAFVENVTFNLAEASDCTATLYNNLQILDDYMNKANENGFQVGQRLYISLIVNYNESQGALLAMTGKFDQATRVFLQANTSEFAIPYNEPPIYSRPVLASYCDLLYYLQANERNPTQKKAYQLRSISIYDSILHSPWHNNSGIYIYGKAYVYELMLDKDNAIKYYKDFLKVWARADPELYMIQHAIDYINRPTPSRYTAVEIALVVIAFFVGIAAGSGGVHFWLTRRAKQEKYIALEKRNEADNTDKTV